MRKSLQASVDGYLWEDHWKRIARREAQFREYQRNYKHLGPRHVVVNELRARRQRSPRLQ